MSNILIIIPYKLLPPRGGGALRCFHLLNQLARFHQIHAIIFQDTETLHKSHNGYSIPETVKVYSPVDNPPPISFFDKFHRRIGPGLHFRFLRRSCRGPAESTLLRCYHLIEEIVRKMHIDVAIFEHISSMYAAPLVKRLSPNTIRVLDAHNVDHVLMEQEINCSSRNSAYFWQSRRSYRNIIWIETHLGKFTDSFFACSDDRITLESLNNIRGFTIPNGVDTRYFGFDKRPEKYKSQKIIFTGSLSYFPNQDGLEYFIEQIWPRLFVSIPEVELVVVGRAPPEKMRLKLEKVSGVHFVGEVPDIRSLLHDAGVAICPLLMGSGTRLKILEYMSSGSPVVSTAIGAEGIEAENGREILIADDPEEFRDAVLKLMNDRALFHSMRQAARKLVETKYDWDVIGDRLNIVLKDLLDHHDRDQQIKIKRVN